jgi:hypothetical protein
MRHIEHVTWKGKLLAYIIRGDSNPEETNFFTPPEINTQIGFIVYSAGSEIARHVHLPLERRIVGTSEVLIVQKGKCLIDIYNEERELVATHELTRGDVMLMVAGGHGFRMLENTVFLEIKQGPYIGLNEKERF